MIISAGVNIYPAEIEQVLMQHPAVKMCAVVGVKDEKWGEKVKAFVVLRKGYEVSEKELEKFLRERIANYKVPKEWAFLDELPMTPSGKVLKRVLKEMK
jgi:acyl-CoA synthetase (AMP-forming)/AMP-acid ligase II